MSSKSFSFPSSIPESFDYALPRTTVRATAPEYVHEDYIRERTRDARCPAAMLAELLDAGEITKEQYERLRRESQ